MADTLDVLTLPEAYTAINDPTSASAATGPNDEMLERFITTISNRLDELVGPIVNRTVTEYHNGGCAVIWPRQTPVSSVTTVTEFDGTTQTALTEDTWGSAGNADGFIVQQSDSYSHDAKILRRSGGSTYHFTYGVEAVRLVYVAGRAADTTAVPARFKMAAGAILRRLWDREAGAWARADNPFDPNALAGSSRFFDAVTHVVNEQLGDEMKPPGLA